MFTPFDILFFISLIFYSLEFLFLRIGLSKANKVQINDFYEPIVTVIVAARNEEETIESCLSSLINLSYPTDKLEIIVVNDHSTDCTREILDCLAQHHTNVHIYDALPETGNLRGKTNAITQAIERSSGEILMFTDADCIVSPLWVRETVKCFSENTGIVGGFTLLSASNVFHGIQALDWLILFSTSSGTAGWGIPLTAIGNNISVRRKAYDETGGYRVIPFSVTEDYALVRAILEKTDYRLAFPLLSNALISSYPCATLKQLFRQKQRWGIGGLDMITHGFIIFAISWLMNILLFIGIFLTPFPVYTAIFFTKIVIDSIYLHSLLKKIKRISYLKYLFAFEVYFIVYVLLIPFIALFSPKVIWKEREL